MIYGQKFLSEFELFKFNKDKNNKYDCPIDKETQDKIEEAAEKSAEKINSKYISRVRAMMKKPNHTYGSYDASDISDANLSNITLQPFESKSFGIEFDDIHQDLFFDIHLELKIWDDIANTLKNDINKVIANNEFKIKKYEIVDDCAVIIMIFA